jgi:hypothetical protein
MKSPEPTTKARKWVVVGSVLATAAMVCSSAGQT